MEKWEELVELEEVEVRNYTMVEPLASRQGHQLLGALARMVARLNYLNLPVRRVHSGGRAGQEGDAQMVLAPGNPADLYVWGRLESEWTRRRRSWVDSERDQCGFEGNWTSGRTMAYDSTPCWGTARSASAGSAGVCDPGAALIQPGGDGQDKVLG